MYPDAYEIGLPNQGVMILYEVLNEQPDVLAERTYAVWPDLAALMREHGVGRTKKSALPAQVGEHLDLVGRQVGGVGQPHGTVLQGVHRVLGGHRVGTEAADRGPPLDGIDGVHAP